MTAAVLFQSLHSLSTRSPRAPGPAAGDTQTLGTLQNTFPSVPFQSLLHHQRLEASCGKKSRCATRASASSLLREAGVRRGAAMGCDPRSGFDGFQGGGLARSRAPRSPVSPWQGVHLLLGDKTTPCPAQPRHPPDTPRIRSAPPRRALAALASGTRPAGTHTHRDPRGPRVRPRSNFTISVRELRLGFSTGRPWCRPQPQSAPRALQLH